MPEDIPEETDPQSPKLEKSEKAEHAPKHKKWFYFAEGLLYIKFHWLAPIIELWRDKQKEGWSVKGVIAFVICICLVLFVVHKEMSGSSISNTTTATATNNSNSPIIAANQSSNVSVKNNSGNTVLSVSGNNFAGQMNLPVNNNGSMTVINNPIYTNPPDTELREFVTNIYTTATFASNGVLLSQAQLSKLTDLLTKLDERTEDVQKLPDGRTSVGGVVVAGFFALIFAHRAF